MNWRDALTLLHVEIKEDVNPELANLRYDVERTGPGDLFVAIREYLQYNQWSDGHDVIDEAICRGAAAVIAERSGTWSVPSALVADSRKALATLAAAWHGQPFAGLAAIGVTGTNGKTTTSHLIAAILRRAGLAPAVLGTIGYFLGRQREEAVYTTPLAPELHEIAARMKAAGADSLVMEVSSHALALDRVFEIPYAQAVFTNFTHDHLDFHGTLDAYLQAKLKLFQGLPSGGESFRAIVNADDPAGARVADASVGRVLTYGFIPEADVRAVGVKPALTGTQIELLFPGQTPLLVSSPLVGRFNVSNVLAAAACAYGRGIPLTAIAEGIADFPGVPGRFQLIRAASGFLIIIDYAHTPDALARALQALDDVPKRRVITVFGCGGDRDRTKRPKMGRIAAESSDWTIVTSDNPRTEDPEAIIAEIIACIPGNVRRRCEAITDRRQAIRRAISAAQTGDIVLIAGKGHEDYQIVGKEKRHFSDDEEARAALAARGDTVA